ncbi:unnamed protein product [Ambrosiozyma monospora]|uniref:Unnamed protein product n=1 Tax=Ambrosiozyma monospora TaxID=43982 RepID=A0A9W6YX97_AMBMO|nr:unnamed protein product [Ambrosiozyma monospora]
MKLSGLLFEGEEDSTACCLRDVFFSNDLKSFNIIYSNVTSNGEYLIEGWIDRIYSTPRLYQSKLKFKLLSKFSFTTHYQIEVSLWISNVEKYDPTLPTTAIKWTSSQHLNCQIILMSI